MNKISEPTRRDIKDAMVAEHIHWSGRINELKFLDELFDLKSLRSLDRRYTTAYDDIHKHRVVNDDGEPDWVFDDPRFNLLHGDDEVFLRFLCKILHPVVRSDAEEVQRLLQLFNGYLRQDGYELVERRPRSGRPEFEAKRIYVPESQVMGEERDVFISYSSEEHHTVARPLAEFLISVGVSVWFDKFDLKVGDSLRETIDDGLSKSRYGIVVLSTSFFSKHYTKRELNGLAQKEVNGEKVILPIWVGVDEHQVEKYSPPLADRKAIKWEDGLINAVLELLKVIKPEEIEKFKKKDKLQLSLMNTGKEILNIAVGCHFSYSIYDDPADETEIDLVSGFIQTILDWSDIWADIDISSQMKAVIGVGEILKELNSKGWNVYAARTAGKKKINLIEDEWTWFVIAVIRGMPKELIFMDDKFFILREPKDTEG